MRLTSRQLKNMVRKEKFLLPEHYEDKIREAMGQIQPEMETVVSKYYSGRLRRRLAFAAAAMLLISGVCVGAGKLRKYMAVDLSGNTFLVDNSEWENLDSVWDYMKENLSYGEFGKFSSITAISGPCFVYHEISSVGKFQKLVKGADAGFRIPAEVPDGYRLEKTYVKFYLDASCKGAEIRKTEKQGSYIYQIFSLPEGFEKNVAAVAMTYRNDKGNYLYYQADLMNNGAMLFGDNAQAEKIKIQGFDSAVSVSEKDGTSIALTQKVDAIKPQEDIEELGRAEYFDYLEKHHIAFMWKWKEMYEGDDEEEEDMEDLNTFHYISYVVKSDVLSLGELRQIADGLGRLG